jgi:pimeloyl-ACP methyl ester carboxylesterase
VKALPVTDLPAVNTNSSPQPIEQLHKPYFITINMATTMKLLPGQDERAPSHFAQINGQRYHYLKAEPPSKALATVVLVHGFPDLAFGWRYQVLPLAQLGFRVIAPDMLGYGLSDAPRDPIPEKEIAFYGLKRAADDMVVLAKQVIKDAGESVDHPVVAVGHDWGGAIVYRLAQYHPGFLTGVASVCTPFLTVSRTYRSIEDVVKLVPNFKYQAQFAGHELEKEIEAKGKDGIRALLNAEYNGKTEDGKSAARVQTGLDLDLALKTKHTPLLTKEELDYYVELYSRNGVHGPFNYYRNRYQNFKDEQVLPPSDAPDGSAKIKIPTLFIQASRDQALPPSMAKGMERNFGDGMLTVKEVDTTHWALWEKPDDVNKYLGDWLLQLVTRNSQVQQSRL